MKFNEQILEKDTNIIKSYTTNSITILDKKYNYNENCGILCKKYKKIY